MAAARFATTPKMPRSAASHSESSGRKASQLGQPRHIDTGPQLAGNPQLALNRNATSSAVVSIFTPPATNSYVFGIWSLAASRIKQKPSLGGQLRAWRLACGRGFTETKRWLPRAYFDFAVLSQAEADAWDPRFPNSMWLLCLSFGLIFDLLLQMARHLAHGLYRPSSHRTQRDGHRVHGLKRRAFATSTARISSSAHKVIVALIGKAIPRRRGLVGWSLISLGSRYRDFTTPLLLAASSKESDHWPQTGACTCMQARGTSYCCTDTARWARIKARNVASILVAASSCIRQVHREGTSC